MWTITDEQLKNISDSMRLEFEKRAFYVLSREDCINGMSEDFVKQNIQKQTDRIVKYGIKDESLAMQFIRLSFEYSELQKEALKDSIHNILLFNEDSIVKIKKLTNYLNINSNE